jgi:hypothetical protein
VKPCAEMSAGGIPSPALVGAWLRLDTLAAEKVPLWAAYWLVAGYDGEALISLAGLHGDDPDDVRDLLPGALEDCGAAIPDSIAAAAAEAFTRLAEDFEAGLAAPYWVAQKADQILARSEYADDVLALPLGKLFEVACEWDGGWGRSRQQLETLIGQACDEQLRYASLGNVDD